MEIDFAPLNLSNFPKHSDKLPNILWHAFKGDHDNVVHHVKWFMTLASKYGIKEEEDVYMRSFVLYLGGKALTWFVGLDKGTISSFAELVETFYNYWDPKQQNKWMPHVEHARNLFNNETQNENQVEEAIVQDLIDDISSIVSEDEVPHANKYDCDHTYEDQEVLVEEVEDQKEMMSYPCQHTTISCNI